MDHRFSVLITTDLNGACVRRVVTRSPAQAHQHVPGRAAPAVDDLGWAA